MAEPPASNGTASTAKAVAAGLFGGSVGAALAFLGWAAWTAPAPAEPAPATALPAPAPSASPTVATIRPLPLPRDRQVSAWRAPDGHFYFDASIDGTGLRMLFDTGASVVTLTAEDAERIGLAPGSLEYSVVTQTANGMSDAAPVVLGTLRVGGITRRNVEAMVVRPGRLQGSLLGQSFMSRLGGYRYEKAELILQDE